MATNIELSIALEKLTARVLLLEAFAEQFSGGVAAALAANSAHAAEALDPDRPLEVGEHVRVKGGDWGNSHGHIVGFLDVPGTPEEDGNVPLVPGAEVDIAAFEDNAFIALDLLARE